MVDKPEVVTSGKVFYIVGIARNQVVNCYYGMPLGEERIGKVGTQETCAPGNQNTHAIAPLTLTRNRNWKSLPRFLYCPITLIVGSRARAKSGELFWGKLKVLTPSKPRKSQNEL